MAKRPRKPILRRPAGTFWIGQRRPPDPGEEPQRLTLYLSGNLLDLAGELAAREGVGSIQDYCTLLLRRALDAERSRVHLEEAEARRGAFEGLQEIASDPDYLAEWTASAESRDRPEPASIRVQAPADGLAVAAPGPSPMPDHSPTPSASPEPNPAARAVLRHAGQDGDDPDGFLPALRRGEPAPIAAVLELEQALAALERDLRGHPAIDRRVAFALHRLAFESQILHTDAWPGAFDVETVATIRSIQEAVERVLSGRDIRFADAGPSPEPHP